MGKTKIRQSIKKSFMVFLGIFLSLSVFLSSIPPVEAAANTYTLFWPDSNTNALRSLFDDGEKQNELEGKIYIVGLGGIFGAKGARFDFTASVNNQLNGQGGGDDNSDNYYATKVVYCKNNNLTFSAPKNRPYNVINYTLGFHANDWKDIQENNTQDLYAGITKIERIGTAGQANEVVFEKGSNVEQAPFVDSKFNPTKLGDDGSHGGKGGNAKDHIGDGCFDKLKRGDIGNLRNYYRLPPAEKRKVDKFVNSEDNKGPSGGAAGAEDNELTDCDIKFSNPLSWILCPVIDLGANGTDWLFQNVIEPLLSDIPLSIDPNNEFFKAWQGFRLIANIILVIGMLGIVYSMARGDR